MKPAQLQLDKRLLGTWKSDRRKTLLHFNPSASIPPRKLQKFKAMFGKFVIRWCPRRYYTELDGHRAFATYEVVASDEESVIIRTRNELTRQDCLKQIHFEGDRYWIAVSDTLNEWFRKLK